MKPEDIKKQIQPASEEAKKRAKERWSHVAKPLGSLGLLEDAVVRIAGIQGQEKICIEKKALVIMCADNGVVEEQVTQTGQEVTAVVTENFTKGDSCACIMAERAGVDVFPVDIGVAGSLDGCGGRYPLVRRRVARGTRNFRREPAMTRQEAEKAIEEGICLAEELKNQGYHLLAVGEMGIGNTTTTSAAASVLLGLDPEVRRGAGEKAPRYPGGDCPAQAGPVRCRGRALQGGRAGSGRPCRGVPGRGRLPSAGGAGRGDHRCCRAGGMFSVRPRVRLHHPFPRVRGAGGAPDSGEAGA